MPRYMKKQTIEELKAFLEGLIVQNQAILEQQGIEALDSIEEELKALVLSPYECVGTSKIIPELYEVRSIENLIFFSEEQLAGMNTRDATLHRKISFVGFQTIEERTFYGGFVGADFTYPAFAVFYQDDEGFLRVYVPEDGNGMNPFSKLEFGYDLEKDDEYCQSRGFTDSTDILLGNVDFMDELYNEEKVKKELLDVFVVKK